MAAINRVERPVEARGVPPKKAAELLGCSRATVYQLLRSGELSSYRLGRARRVTLASIEHLIGG